MKRLLLATFALALTLLAASAASAQQAVPEIPFEADVDFLKLPPDLYLGEVSGVAVNSSGHVFIFNRGNTTGPAYAATASQLLEFGADGQFLREIGKNLYAWSYAHAVKIDRDDNIWVVDKGSDTILKLSPQGRVVWVFGRKGEASHYQMPPDTAATLSGRDGSTRVSTTCP